MAQRRMVSPKVIDTDDFMDMPASTQNLYFHMLLRADDDGFLANPKRIVRLVAANDDDLKVLMAKMYILPFESGICVIRHWRIHNLIRADRYHETIYTDEKAKLAIDDNGVYAMATKWQPNGNQRLPEVRLGKVSIGKSSKSRADARHPKLDVPINQNRYDSLCEKHGGEQVDEAIQERIDWESTKGRAAARDYASAAANWLAKAKEYQGTRKNPNFERWDPEAI